MDVGEIISAVGMIFGFVFQAAVLLVGLVLAWGRIKGTIDGLTGSIERLTRSVDNLDTKLDEHSERLARLEARS